LLRIILRWAPTVGVSTFIALCLFVWGYALAENQNPLATHFDAVGRANGWQPLLHYALFITLSALVTQTLVVGLCFSLRWMPPNLLNVPRAAYWRLPENYPVACDLLLRSSWLFVAVQNLWWLMLHKTIVLANASAPPSLPPSHLGGSTALLLGGICLWCWIIVRVFSSVPLAPTENHSLKSPS